MKKSLCIFLTVIIAATAIPVSAADIGEQPEQSEQVELIELIEGTYAPNQVVVMFKDLSVDADNVTSKGGLAAVGADFGEKMSAYFAP